MGPLRRPRRAALNNWTEALAKELAPAGAWRVVNIVTPGTES